MARPTVTLEVRFASAPFTDSGTWTDISAYCQALEIQTGRTYELERFSPGRATFTLRDTTRRFDPEYTSGAWFGQLTPGKQIRCRATYNAVTYDLFRGYVSDWGAASIPDRDNLYRNTVTALDALAQFESVGLPASWLELAVGTDSPTHWWRLDETQGTSAVDYGGGTRYDGYYTAGPTLNDAEVVPLDGGRKGVTFNGVDQLAVIPGAASEGATNFTLEVWFTTTQSIGSSTTAEIVKVGYSSPGITLAINNNGTDTVGYSEFLGATGLGLSGTTTINDGNPHQMVLTRSGTTATLYIDGASVASGTTNSNALETACFEVASPNRNYATQQFFAGTVSNVAFWSSTLNAAAILDHYNAGMRGYTGTDTGAMLALILDYKGWPSTLRTLSTGSSTVGAYDLPTSLSEFVGRMADTEAGQTYVSGDGKVTHRNRHLWLDTRSRTSQATFGDLHGAATLNYTAEGFLMPLDEQQIRNPVYASRAGGVTASAQDATLISSTYGERGYNAPTAYDDNDNVMIDRAGYFLARFKNGKSRLKAMRLTPERNQALLYPQALGRVLGDRITVKRKPLNAGNETSLDFIIEGVRHASTPESWETTFWGSQAETTGWILDDATYSVLGTTTILTY